MTYQIIIANKAVKYIRDMPEYINDLPDNCYLDKTVTGSGGTTHALTNAIPYVIAVPFISLAENKKSTTEGVQDVHSGVSDMTLLNYIKEGGKKFIVTYDSLPRLEKLIDVSQYKILIDEAHKLVEYGADFKPKVINHILTNYTKYKAHIFMTATPTREEFLPDELQDILKIKIQWEGASPVNILHQRCNLQLDSIVSNLCLEHLRGHKEGNAYLFYNSIKAIAKTIKTLRKIDPSISQDDIKIICANNANNIKLVQTYIGKTWSISKPLEKDEQGNVLNLKRITFVTSTAFEGSDFFDENGVTYIISDGRKVHTKLDITTQVSQIVGRIRNSKYNNTVNMLWIHSPIGECLSEEEYSNYIKGEEDEARVVIEDFTNSRASTTKKALINYTMTNPFFIDNSEEDPDLIFNTLARKALMNTYVGMELTYHIVNNSTNTEEDTVPTALKDIFTTAESLNIFEPLSGTDKLRLGKTPNYKKICMQYEQALITGEQEIIDDIETDIDYKDLVDFVEIFSINKLSSVSYQKSKIITELNKYNMFKNNVTKLKRELKLVRNQFYTAADLKQRFQDAYTYLQIPGKPVAATVKTIYNAKATKKNNEKGYLIGSELS